MDSGSRLARVGFLFLVSLAVAGQVQAQTDLSGEWAVRLHEDEPHRQAGPNAEVPGRHGIELGDYTGMPINAAARLMADSWDASIQTLPEHQLEPAGAPLWVAGVGNLRISKIVNDETQEVVAFKIFRSPGTTTTRMIWLDGRSHPPEYAPHTWEGFSTGYWEGNMLTVETTHLKRAYLQLNGIYLSDRATLVEHFVRHGNYLTIISVVTDPLYLDEPFIRSASFAYTPDQQLESRPASIEDEVAGRKPGYVPHHLPGTNEQLKEFCERVGLPFEATRGGKASIYPEYQLTLKALMGKSGMKHAD